jgi:glucose/galactose transporter
VVAAGILRSPLPDLKASDANASSVPAGEADARSVFSYPHLWLGVLCLFVYVGVEVMAGDAIGAYGRAFGLPLDQTKFFTAFTLGAMLLGYLAGLVLTPKIMSQDTYLRASAVLGLALVAGAFLTKGYVSVGFVASLGFANAMMWPAIFPLAIKGLGKATETGSALLVMGIAGGAIIPQAFAALKQHYDFQAVFAVLMAPCYLYILYYAWLGCRAKPSDPATPAAALVGP